MSTSIVIIVAAVVILITALVVMSVFSGGIGTFQSIFNPWANQTGNTVSCEAQCRTLCSFATPDTGEPAGWSDTKCGKMGKTCNCKEYNK